MVGCLGNINFYVSYYKVMTFQNLTRKRSARYATHEVIGRKPVQEYIGPGVFEANLDVRLDASLGIKPEQQLKSFSSILTSGKAVPLVVGREYLGTYVVTDISETRAAHTGKGDLLRVDLSISLKEAE